MSAFITIKTYSYRHEAEIDQNILQSHGIPSMIQSDDTGGMRPHLSYVSGVKLIINKEDMEKAQDLIGNVS